MEGYKKGTYLFGISKVGEKGQIVIPKEARDMLGIKPGDTILVLGDEERGIAIPPKATMNKMISQIMSELSMEEEESHE